MKTRQEAINFCKTLAGAYEDYPFHDANWTIMRHRESDKMFAAIFSRSGHIWINVKCDPNLAFMWRGSFQSVIPAYHMNKTHWNSIILDGTVPEEAVKAMITDSYMLTGRNRAARGGNRSAR